MPRRHRKNKTMKRGGMWPFGPSTPTTSSSSWWGSSSWSPFSSNKPSASSSTYGASPSQPIQPSSYPPAAPDQYQADQYQGQSDYNQDYNQPVGGYRRKKQRQTKKALLITYPDLRPSLSRNGGKTKKMTKRRKH